MTDRPVKITLPGPMTITDSLANAFYSDPRTQDLALAEALNAEVRGQAAAGCRHIQVDKPVFARKPQQALDYGIENLERVFHGVPEDVQRIVHMCCGYPSALDTPDYPKADSLAYFQIAGAWTRLRPRGREAHEPVRCRPRSRVRLRRIPRSDRLLRG